jgi:hypothetical protein
MLEALENIRVHGPLEDVATYGVLPGREHHPKDAPYEVFCAFGSTSMANRKFVVRRLGDPDIVEFIVAEPFVPNPRHEEPVAGLRAWRDWLRGRVAAWVTSAEAPTPWPATCAWPVETSTVDLEPIETTHHQIYQLRFLSGLTWDALAEVFCVSRRSLHFWAGGSTMTRLNAQKLAQLLQIVRQADRGTAQQNRDLWLAPGPDGRRPVDLAAVGAWSELAARVGKGPGRPTRPPTTNVLPPTPPAPWDLASALHGKVHQDLGPARVVKAIRREK